MGSFEFKVVDFAIQLAVVLFAISFHESAHALAALRMGDTTARDLGRISLNPMRHIDPFGSVLLPILLYLTSGLIFGYAKPTPVNLRNTRNPRLADLLVSGAGPFSNFLLAAGGVLVLVAIRGVNPDSRIGTGIVTPLWEVAVAFVRVNLGLGVFNLVPIPPLDGSWVAASVFGAPVQRFFHAIAPFGFMILIFLSYTGVLGVFMVPVFRALASLISRIVA